jgi:putative solute:sodium symporter small subunit
MTCGTPWAMMRAMDDLPSNTFRDRRVLALKLGLGALWIAVSFGACYFARELDFTVFDWPLGYWVAAQGALMAFIAIVAVHAWAMKRLVPEDALPAATAEESRL